MVCKSGLGDYVCYDVAGSRLLMSQSVRASCEGRVKADEVKPHLSGDEALEAAVALSTITMLSFEHR